MVGVLINVRLIIAAMPVNSRPEMAALFTGPIYKYLLWEVLSATRTDQLVMLIYVVPTCCRAILRALVKDIQYSPRPIPIFSAAHIPNDIKPQK